MARGTCPCEIHRIYKASNWKKAKEKVKSPEKKEPEFISTFLGLQVLWRSKRQAIAIRSRIPQSFSLAALTNAFPRLSTKRHAQNTGSCVFQAYGRRKCVVTDSNLNNLLSWSLECIPSLKWEWLTWVNLILECWAIDWFTTSSSTSWITTLGSKSSRSKVKRLKEVENIETLKATWITKLLTIRWNNVLSSVWNNME